MPLDLKGSTIVHIFLGIVKKNKRIIRRMERPEAPVPVYRLVKIGESESHLEIEWCMRWVDVERVIGFRVSTYNIMRTGFSYMVGWQWYFFLGDPAWIEMIEN